MQKEITYDNVHLLKPKQEMEDIFHDCADELEKKLPQLKKFHLRLRLEEESRKSYCIELRLVSEDDEYFFDIQTKNIPRGLGFMRRDALRRLREAQKKRRHRERSKSKVGRLEQARKDSHLQLL